MRAPQFHRDVFFVRFCGIVYERIHSSLRRTSTGVFDMPQLWTLKLGTLLPQISSKKTQDAPLLLVQISVQKVRLSSHVVNTDFAARGARD